MCFASAILTGICISKCFNFHWQAGVYIIGVAILCYRAGFTLARQHRQEIARLDEFLKFHASLLKSEKDPVKRCERKDSIDKILDRRNILTRQTSHETN